MKYNYKVTGTRLAFRSEPVVADNNLIARIDTNTMLIGGEPRPDGWVPCEYNGKSGYCMAKYLQNMGALGLDEMTDKEKLDILWAEYLKNK